jgi:hypothetical protein
MLVAARLEISPPAGDLRLLTATLAAERRRAVARAIRTGQFGEQCPSRHLAVLGVAGGNPMPAPPATGVDPHDFSGGSNRGTTREGGQRRPQRRRK